MPFKSEAQRRWMYANHPEMAKRWSEHTPKGKKLPEYVKEKKASMNTQEAYINGFVKRAAEYGYSEDQAVELYKQAAGKLLTDAQRAVSRAGAASLKNMDPHLRTVLKQELADRYGGTLHHAINNAQFGGLVGAGVGGLSGLLDPGEEVDPITGHRRTKSRLTGALGGALTGGLAGGALAGAVGGGIHMKNNDWKFKDFDTKGYVREARRRAQDILPSAEQMKALSHADQFEVGRQYREALQALKDRNNRLTHTLESNK